MSFEIKYDKNGYPIPDPATAQRVEAEKVAALAAQQQVNAPVSEPSVSPNQTSTETESIPEPQESISNDPGPSDAEYQAATEQAQTRQQKTKEDNLRALREKSERLERERDEYMRQLQEAQSKKLDVDESDITIDDSDVAEGKHLKKLQAEIKRLRKEADANRQQSTMTQAEIRLRAQYPDFDKVVSADNVNSLREEYPELAVSLNSNNDIYSKAVSAYTMIKKLGIHQEPVYAADKARIAQNANKPKPSATIAPQKSDSPLSQANAFANGLTPDLQKQLWAEMQALRKNY